MQRISPRCPLSAIYNWLISSSSAIILRNGWNIYGMPMNAEKKCTKTDEASIRTSYMTTLLLVSVSFVTHTNQPTHTYTRTHTHDNLSSIWSVALALALLLSPPFSLFSAVVCVLYLNLRLWQRLSGHFIMSTFHAHTHMAKGKGWEEFFAWYDKWYETTNEIQKQLDQVNKPRISLNEKPKQNGSC